MLLDENARPGGRIWQALETRGAADPDDVAALNLIRRFRASDGSTRWNASVWAIEPDGRVFWSEAEQAHTTRVGRNVLLATGTTERPLPIPGWTLAGRNDRRRRADRAEDWGAGAVRADLAGWAGTVAAALRGAGAGAGRTSLPVLWTCRTGLLRSRRWVIAFQCAAGNSSRAGVAAKLSEAGVRGSRSRKSCRLAPAGEDRSGTSWRMRVHLHRPRSKMCRALSFRTPGGLATGGS